MFISPVTRPHSTSVRLGGSATVTGAKARINSITQYYPQIDRLDYNAVMRRFADKAVYERDGYSPFMGKPAIRHFFENLRTLRGRHIISSGNISEQPLFNTDASLPEGPRIYVKGHFTGTDRGQPVRKYFHDLWIFNPSDNKVFFRKSRIWDRIDPLCPRD